MHPINPILIYILAAFYMFAIILNINSFFSVPASRSRQPSIASPSGSPKSNDGEKNKSIRSRKVKKSNDSGKNINSIFD